MPPTNGHGPNLTEQWKREPRWRGIVRTYSEADVLRLRGSIHIGYSLARLGAERLWSLLETEPYVPTLGAMTGNQAVQMAQAGQVQISTRTACSH